MKDLFRDYVENVMLPAFGACSHVWVEADTVGGWCCKRCMQPKPSPADCRHEWLRPDNGVIECASCGATRLHYGDSDA